MSAWEGKAPSWRLHRGHRCYAHVIVEPGCISWTARRRGEITPWHEVDSVEDAKYYAEIELEDMPEIGPLEV